MGLRNRYAETGVDTFYKTNAETYTNPHEKIIHRHIEDIIPPFLDKNIKILDLCAESGEITRKLVDIGFSNIEGLDPYTYNLYQKKTGKLCLNYSFKDIAQGRLKRKYDLVICSFALHLAEESLLPFILYNLSLITDKLIIISPSELLPTIGRGF